MIYIYIYRARRLAIQKHVAARRLCGVRLRIDSVRKAEDKLGRETCLE